MVESSNEFKQARAEKAAKEQAKATETTQPERTEQDQIKFEEAEFQKDDDEDKKIQFTVLGGCEECPVASDDECLDYCMRFRIPKIENLEKCTKLTTLLLRKNLIKKLEGLDNNVLLEELEMYDNRLRHIDNIGHLVNLTFLDLSFNRIKEIGGMDTLVNLKKLYVSSNRIKKMENLNTLVNLSVLDVGDNRIRKIEGIDKLVNLREFHAAKNKLQVIEGLDTLVNLELVAMQVNFIHKIGGLENLSKLEELYLQQNQVKEIGGLEANLCLETLDLAMNKLTKFGGLEHLSTEGTKTLRELWLNWNYIEDSVENREYMTRLGTLKTIYLADNPLSLGDDYQKMMVDAIPGLQQIDGNQLRKGVPFHHQRTEGIHSIVKKQMNPRAQEILAEVVQKQNSEGPKTIQQLTEEVAALAEAKKQEKEEKQEVEEK